MTGVPAPAAPARAGVADSLHLLGAVIFTLLVYLLIGLVFATIPRFVGETLGFGPTVAGSAVSLQFLATFATRAWAGRLSDRDGPKPAVVLGFAVVTLSGACLMVPEWWRAQPWLALAALGVSRMLLGTAESLVGTATLTWAIARTGRSRMARVISWNGIMSYGGMALGAPLGALIAGRAGMPGLGGFTVLVGVIGICLSLSRPGVRTEPGAPMRFAAVFRRVLPFGAALALASTGFGTIAAFIALYYAARGWHGAAYALTAFGVCFAGFRVVLDRAFAAFGPLAVALLSLLLEAAALVALANAAGPGGAALSAALVGTGFSAMFPALGVSAVARVPDASRGAALGAFNLFFDAALFLIGPVAGAIAVWGGYQPVFLAASVSVGAAWGIVFWLWRETATQGRASFLKKRSKKPL